MKKVIAIITAFYLASVIFLPKERLFFLAQNYLKKENIYINTTPSEDISLNLKESEIFINGIKTASIKESKIYLFFLFNKAILKDIKTIKYKISSITLTNSIISPFEIDIKGEAKSFSLNGKIDLKTRTIKVYFLNLKDNFLKRVLKKDAKGYYYYERF
jgi:hypothetical protein